MRILYGVMGNTYGHVMRTQAIVERLMPEHEFYFVGGGRVPEALGKRGWRVLEVPVLRTVHRHGKVSVSRVVGQIAGRLLDAPRVVRQVGRLIEDFRPDLAICDREFFVPIACRWKGLTCVSLDHSHVLKACRYPVPASERVSWALAMLNDYLLFDLTRRHLIVSFFHPPLRQRLRGRGDVDELLPPVLRPAVTRITAKQGEHVLVYQTSATFKPLLEPLARLDRPVIVYGYGTETEAPEGEFAVQALQRRGDFGGPGGVRLRRGERRAQFDLRGTLFRQAVLCFPIARLFEQFINAWHVRALGYGDFCTEPRPGRAVFDAFEARLDAYRAAVAAAGSFDGTARVVERVRETIRAAEVAKRVAGRVG